MIALIALIWYLFVIIMAIILVAKADTTTGLPKYSRTCFLLVLTSPIIFSLFTLLLA